MQGYMLVSVPVAARGGASPVKVSVIIPVYNERALILEIIRRALVARLPEGVSREVVVIDDGSDDGTAQLLRTASFPDNVIIHGSILNHGKGAAVRAGFKVATGDIFLIQDGDLEYDPLDSYFSLIMPFFDADVDVVYGSRFARTEFPEGMAVPNWIANRILTLTTRVLYRTQLTDEATGYKVFRRGVLDCFEMTSNGFEFCPEFTAKALLSGHRIVEVPITYQGRNLPQGKKIRARHAFTSMYALFHHRMAPVRKKRR
jgi:dolichol-phosphate mannosyltransferase